MRSHSCGLDFVAGGAHPTGVVGQSLTLLSLQTRLHLTPPLADDDGRWGRQAQTGNGDGFSLHTQQGGSTNPDNTNCAGEYYS